MTVLCIALLLMGAPCERGGHALPAADHGGHAVAVTLYWRDLDRLGVERVRDLPRFPSWICLHEHEGAWNDPNDTYWGGLQMNRAFMRAYGADMLREHAGEGVGGQGLADSWTAAEQIIVAERAYSTRGFGPWPLTRLACGI